MNSKERVLTALAHKQPDKAPFCWGLGVNEPVKRDLAKHLNMNMDEVNEYLEELCDLHTVEVDYVGPKNREKTNEDGTYTDLWGVTRREVSYGEGFYDEICGYPLKDVKTIEDLDNIVWPTADWADTSKILEKINKINEKEEQAIRIWNGNIFETSWYMRGFEQMFMDMVMEPELATEIMRRVTDYFISYFRKILEAAKGKVDIVFTADDIGGQQGLLMSLDMWEELIKPHHIRMNKVLHEYGVKILYHTDGAIMKAIPGLIDMGIDVLEALQYDAEGMDPNIMKDNYGDVLSFHGGISVQKTIPFGTVEDVKNEVIERIKVLGKDGGYILAPSHALQAGTPVENLMAFIDVAKNQEKYV